MKTNELKKLDVLLCSDTINKRDSDNKFKLPPLPYSEDALEPYISQKTLQYHYGKHLAAYIDKTNNFIKGTEFENMSLEEIILKSENGLFNNSAQIFNHLFYFETFKPNNSNAEPQGRIKDLIDKTYGNFATFKEKFNKAATDLFGSGYAWLVVDDSDKLEIISTGNADTPIRHGQKPLLTIDVWEHAYYLDTQNARPKYIENFWNIINWDVVNKRV